MAKIVVTAAVKDAQAWLKFKPELIAQMSAVASDGTSYVAMDGSNRVASTWDVPDMEAFQAAQDGFLRLREDELVLEVVVQVIPPRLDGRAGQADGAHLRPLRRAAARSAGGMEDAAVRAAHREDQVHGASESKPAEHGTIARPRQGVPGHPGPEHRQDGVRHRRDAVST